MFELLRIWFDENLQVAFECDEDSFEIYWFVISFESQRGEIEITKDCMVIGEIPPGFDDEKFKAHCKSLLK